jgi:hypothetical protein
MAGVIERSGLGRALLVSGCLYEIVALTTRRVPTITAAIKTIGRSHPVGRLVVWGWCGYVAWHFLEPESPS